MKTPVRFRGGFYFDVVGDRRSARFPNVLFTGLEYVTQQGFDRGPWLLLRKAGMTASSAIPTADFRIVHLKKVQCLFARRIGYPVARTGADLGRHPGFVGDDHLAVGGGHDIQFQCGDAEIECLDKAGDGVFRKEGTTTPMALQVECGCLCGTGAHDRCKENE